jgi:hypothetical protein
LRLIWINCFSSVKVNNNTFNKKQTKHTNCNLSVSQVTYMLNITPIANRQWDEIDETVTKEFPRDCMLQSLALGKKIYFSGDQNCPIIEMDIAQNTMTPLDVQTRFNSTALAFLTATEIIIQYDSGETDVLNTLTNELDKNHTTAPYIASSSKYFLK